MQFPWFLSFLQQFHQNIIPAGLLGTFLIYKNQGSVEFSFRSWVNGCISACRSPNRLKKIQACSNTSPSIAPCVYYHTAFCTMLPIAYLCSQTPLLRSYFCLVTWEQSQGAVRNPSPNTRWAHSLGWGAFLGLRSVLLSRDDGLLAHAGVTKSTSKRCQVFSEIAAQPDEFLMLSSSFSVHVLLGVPAPQRWVLDLLHPDTHASLLGMAVPPSLACSCRSYSPSFLTPREQTSGMPGCERVGELCVCWWRVLQCFSPYWPVLPRLGSVSLEKNLSPFCSRGCTTVLVAPM